MVTVEPLGDLADVSPAMPRTYAQVTSGTPAPSAQEIMPPSQTLALSVAPLPAPVVTSGEMATLVLMDSVLGGEEPAYEHGLIIALL